MLRIVLVAAAIVAVMVGIKHGHVLQKAGLLGSCSVVRTPIGQSGEWHACHGGKISQAPNLSRNSCTDMGQVGEQEYWRCPAPVAAAKVHG